MRFSIIVSLFLQIFLAQGGTDAVASASCQKYDDNYDNLATNAILPQLSNVGTYNGLTYTSWVVAEPGLANGVLAHSTPNVASAAMAQNLLTMGDLTLTPFGEISAGPGVKYFDLFSFYFGCITDLQNSEVSLSEGCTISVTGYYYDGTQVPEATFAFAPTTTLGAPLVLASLPSSYVGLQNVTIGVADASLLAAETVLDIDDLVHCNYS